MTDVVATSVLELKTDDTKLNQGLVAAEARVMGFTNKFKAGSQDVKKFGEDGAATFGMFTKGAGQAETGLGKMFSGLKGVAGLMGITFGVSALVSFGSAIVDNAGHVQDLADKMGTTTGFAQRMEYAMQQTGGSIENVSQSLVAMQKNLAGGGASVVGALKDAGLQFSAVRAMKPEQAFEAIVEAIKKIPDPMTQTRVATELFGKAGAEMLPAIRAGMVELGRQAPIMSAETIEALDAMGDAWGWLKTKVKTEVAEMIGGPIAAWRKVIGALSGEAEEAARAAVAASIPKPAIFDAVIPKIGATGKALEDMMEANKKLGDQMRKDIPAFEKQNDKIRDLADELTGKKLAAQVRDLDAALKLAGGSAALTWKQFDALAKRASDMRKDGAELTGELKDLADGYDILQFNVKLSESSVKGLNEQLKTQGAIIKTLTLPPWINAGGIAEFKKQLAGLNLWTETGLTAPPPPPKANLEAWKAWGNDIKAIGKGALTGFTDSLVGMSGRTHQERTRQADDAARDFDRVQAETNDRLGQTEADARRTYAETTAALKQNFEKRKKDAYAAFEDMKNSGEFTAEELERYWIEMNVELERDSKETNKAIDDAHQKMVDDIAAAEKVANEEIEAAHQAMLDAKEGASHRWKNNLKDIWDGVKLNFQTFLSDMLADWEQRFLQGAIDTLLGKEDAFTNAFKGVFGRAGKAGGKAAMDGIGSEFEWQGPKLETTAAGAGGKAGSAWATGFMKIAGPALEAWAMWKFAGALLSWIGDGNADRGSQQDPPEYDRGSQGGEPGTDPGYPTTGGDEGTRGGDNYDGINYGPRGFAIGTPRLDYMRFRSRGEPVILHGDEAVIPRGRTHRLAADIAAAMGPRGGVSLVIQALDAQSFEGWLRNGGDKLLSRYLSPRLATFDGGL